MKGRKLGTREISIEEIGLIVEMTESNCSRRHIAETLNRSHDTVWRYQKQLGLL